jgi:hypothetical protein
MSTICFLRNIIYASISQWNYIVEYFKLILSSLVLTQFVHMI